MSRLNPDPGQPRGILFSPLLEAAVRLAARGHYNQFRKNVEEAGETAINGPFLPDRVPYIAHLTGVMCILARFNVRDEVLAAAVLHDYLEDVPDPDGRESIRRVVGDEVLSLVLDITENKRPDLARAESWDVRKREQIDHLAHMPEEAILIKAADVLHNVQSLLYDLETVADAAEIWLRFNAEPDRQLWYFESVTTAVEKRLGDHPLAKNLDDAVARLRSVLKK